VKDHRFIGALALVLFVSCVVGIARAQTQPWDTNVLAWLGPTTCSTGEPITSCPVLGYRVERSATTTGTFTTVATNVTALTYIHNGAVAGQNCYRVIALSAAGDSLPSNVACKTNVRPAGPPNPPTNLTVTAPTAYDVRPNETTFAFDRGRAVGTAKLGAACDETRSTGNGFYALERPSRVTLTRNPRSTALVAQCG